MQEKRKEEKVIMKKIKTCFFGKNLFRISFRKNGDLNTVYIKSQNSCKAVKKIKKLLNIKNKDIIRIN